MLERYRSEYLGEFVVVHTLWKNQKKVQKKEWVPNPIENKHISSRAVVIGPGESRSKFDISLLENHKGGLLGRLSLQSYGTDALYKEMTPNFLITFDEDILLALKGHYAEKNVVYTSTKMCLKYPGEFYMVPHNIRNYAISVAIYLAAFDEHKEVFLVGVDGLTPQEEHAIADVFKAYKKTRFVVVSDTPIFLSKWRRYPNVDQWDYRKFISHCDI